MRTVAGLLCLTLGIAGCGDDGTTLPTDACDLEPLPLSGSASGPVVQDVTLEVQAGVGIVVLATAMDPQGTDGLLNVQQTVGVFPDSRCQGAPLQVFDDLAASGVEESFGTAVGATANLALFNAIQASTTWPVEVDFLDVDGNRTQGRVEGVVSR